MSVRPLLIFGRNGQLARAIARSLRARGQDFRALGSQDCDLVESVEACAAHIRGVSAVINASAFTAVDAAETRAHANRQLNTHAPGAMATACAKQGIPFVHVSTDYVFDGDASAPWRPDAPTAPLNAYGRAKAAGERAVRAAGGTALILRTSWVHDGAGRNFVTTMMGLKDKPTLRVVDDQMGRPTQAGHLAEAIIKATDHGWQGVQTHHVQDSGHPLSWADFAEAIFKRRPGPGPRIERIPSRDYPTPAARPAWSVLDTSGFETTFAHPMPP